MHIQTLKLKRFRGAESLSLELDKKLNVFVGMNGAGKSSVLDAAALLLSWLVNRIKHAGTSGRPITESDIQNGEVLANIAMTLYKEERGFTWNLRKVRQGRSSRSCSKLVAASELAKQFQALISDTDGKTNLPLFAYYPVNRAVLDIPLRLRTNPSFDLLSAYEDALNGVANFRTFFEWFREREDLENEARRDRESLLAGNLRAAFPDAQLEAVRIAVTQFMPEFKNLTVRRNPLRMEVEKQGERLSVSQLSDGEKCLLAMVGDVARRLAIANPERDNPLEGEGVVLIDEIDLHIHPVWQRRVVPRLGEVFPNIQFLISTHSPHVITHVRPENLFLLKMGGNGLELSRVTESYGKTVERILEDLMGLDTTRPTGVAEALRQIYAQLDEGDLVGARTAIAKLEQEIGSDPELSKADVLIKRKELIGK